MNRISQRSCGRASFYSNRICDIRKAEKESHEQIYISIDLFQKGSWLEKPVKAVMDLLPLFEDDSVLKFLDLGCGVGRNAIPIAQYFEKGTININCVDLLPVAIEKLNENADRYNVRDSIHGIISSIEDFVIEKNLYNFIFSVSSIEHVENEEVFVNKLREIYDGLCENGLVCLIINSEIHEYDSNSNIELEPQFEVNLSTEKILELLNSIFQGKILVKKVKAQHYSIPRGKRNVNLKTNVVTFIARKI